jgi:hypothetical protein
MLPIQTAISESIEPVPEVIATRFTVGRYDDVYWAKARFRCVHCGKLHVCLHDGKFLPGAGRDLPTAFLTFCKLTQKRIYVRGWQKNQNKTNS